MSKLWETGGDSDSGSGKGRAGAAADEIADKVESFTVGNDYLLDKDLLPFDVKASKVHVDALQQVGVLSAGEAESLQKGLDRILELCQSGSFEIRRDHEDGHTAIEVWLTAEFGDLGKKIHTGRSRNDQVLTAMRLYEKDGLRMILAKTLSCITAILDVAEDNRRVPMPGYTHTRKAMLSSAGQWLGGFAELLIMQHESSSGVRALIDRSPLGTAAGFGTTIGLDRDAEAEALGFSQSLVCATAAQMSRGWAELQLVQYLSGITTVLARMAGDIIQFSSQAYGFLDIRAEFCTGSSIMPNKKNPDVAELIRGRNAQMAGYAAALQGVISNLGSGYHRDLQLTKEPVMKAFETAEELLEMTALLVRGLTFNEEVLRSACSADLLAAEEAYKLVKEEGMSFRDAYKEIKGRSEARASMSLEDLFEEYTQLGSPGHPGLDRLRDQTERLKEQAEKPGSGS